MDKVKYANSKLLLRYYLESSLNILRDSACNELGTPTEANMEMRIAIVSFLEVLNEPTAS